MRVGVKYAAALMAPVTAIIIGCVAVAHSPAQKWFNQESFVGLYDLSSSYESVTLAYDLDGRDGELVNFSSCNGVEDVEETDVVQSQFSLYRKLYINCLGAKYFHSGSEAERSYLPSDFSQSVINSFPASVVPNRGGNSLQVESGKMLLERDDVEVVEPKGKRFTLNVGTTEVDYVLLSEVDANNDGFQDWVLRLDWSQTDSFGEGADLIILTRKTMGGDIEVVTRYP